MLLHVKRRELRSLAVLTAKAVSQVISEELKGILLEADAGQSTVTLTATNVEVTIRTILPASVEQSGSVIVAPDMLIGILERLPGDIIDLELKEASQLYAASESASFLISVKPGAKYPPLELPFPDDTVPVQGIHTLGARTVFAASKEKSNPAMTCVQCNLRADGLWATSCNGACLMQVHGSRECRGDTSFLVPASSLALLANMSDDEDVYQMGLTGKSVVFWDGSLMFSTRLVEGSFLNTAQVLSAIQGSYKMQVNAAALSDALDSVSTVDSKNRVEIGFHDHELALRCESGIGFSTKCVPALSAGMPPTPFYHRPNMLRASLKTIKDTVTISFSNQGLMLLEADGVTCLHTPIRPPKPSEVFSPEQAASPGRRKKAA